MRLARLWLPLLLFVLLCPAQAADTSQGESGNFGNAGCIVGCDAQPSATPSATASPVAAEPSQSSLVAMAPPAAQHDTPLSSIKDMLGYTVNDFLLEGALL